MKRRTAANEKDCLYYSGGAVRAFHASDHRREDKKGDIMKMRFLAAILAAFFMFPYFSVAAHAGGGDNTDYEEPQQQQIIDITPRTEAPSATITVTDNIETDNAGENQPVAEPVSTSQNPFTPSGTGTVADNATDGDGKEFFTIMTPDENVFYLVIDRQRTTENVYLLNAVTEADLLSLAKMPERTATTPAVTEPTPAPAEPEPEPTPEKSGGAGMLIMVIVIVIGGGGAGWYFKIYRPKQQQADDGEEIDGENYGDDESDPYGDEQDAGPDYDGADWYGEDDAPDGDGGEDE